jgi:hypothetical protein
MSTTLEQRRKEYGHRFYDHFTRLLATDAGKTFHGGNKYRIRAGRITLGLRVCSIRVDCGFDNDRLLKSINSNNVGQLVPWTCAIEPVAYPYGKDSKFAVIDAVWPPGLERADVQLGELEASLSGDRMVVGPNQAGEVITLPSHHIEHLLVAGQTGSGKSWTLRSLGYQLSMEGRGLPNQLVLLDGKGGEGLGILNGVRGQVGPLALDTESTVNALTWCVIEMSRRYDAIRQGGGFKLNGEFPHVFVLFDEFQRYTKDGANTVVVELMNLLATQGRAAHIHLIAGTQKPLVGVFGDSTTPDQFSAAIGGRVKSWHASRAIMGDTTPRCDMLLPGGDAYVKAVVPDLVIDRVQMAYVPEQELAAAAGGKLQMEHWPACDLEDVAGVSQGRGRPKKPTTDEELAVGLLAAVGDYGRDWFRERLDKPPGASRADRIIDKSHRVLAEVYRRGGKLVCEEMR